MEMTPHGYCLLMPDAGVQPSRDECAAALDAAGWERWDGNGWPAFVVFHASGPKGDFFEAGFWAGQGVPLFFLGAGARCYKRKQIVSRFGGWTLIGEDGRANVAGLLEAIGRRGLLLGKA